MPQSVPIVLAIAGVVLVILGLIGGGLGGNVILRTLSNRERIICAVSGLGFVLVAYLLDRPREALPPPPATAVASATTSQPSFSPTSTLTSDPATTTPTMPAAESPTAMPTLAQDTPMPTSTLPTEQPTASSLSSEQPSAPAEISSGLSPDEVRTWCQGEACNPERFEQLIEANGLVNPYGVHLKAGNPVILEIPEGVSVDVWDCFKASIATGPTTLRQVCEASIRRTP